MACTNTEKLGDVLVLGIGKTGEGICRYLAGLPAGRVDSVTLYGGARSEECDATRALEGMGVRCVLGTEDVEGAFDLAVASPGIPEKSAFSAPPRPRAPRSSASPSLPSARARATG